MNASVVSRWDSKMFVMTLADRMAEVRKATGLNKSRFGELIGVSHTAVNNYENGQIKEISYSVLKRIQAKTGFQVDWIAYGKLPKKAKNVTFGQESDNLQEFSDTNAGKLPLISFVRAGNWDEVLDPYELNDAEEWLHSPIPHGDRAFLVRNRGESMDNGRSDGYPDGVILQIDPEVEARHGRDVIARTPDGQATFKRLQVNHDGRFLLALNESWPNRIIQIPADTVIIGVCTGYWVDRR